MSAPSDRPDPGRLSHLDETGAAQMVDVGGKPATTRKALASGVFRTTAEVIALLSTGGLPKGDALATARIAGIMAAKKTAELIPLCHQVALSTVGVDFDLGIDTIEVRATAVTTDRTGVEMEALTAVAVTGLTLHDMVKAVDPRALMTDICLQEKTGGKKGHWTRQAPAAGDTP